MRTFLHTVQKNQMLMMTPTSRGRSGVIKSFIKHTTPLRVDPKVSSHFPQLPSNVTIKNLQLYLQILDIIWLQKMHFRKLLDFVALSNCHLLIWIFFLPPPQLSLGIVVSEMLTHYLFVGFWWCLINFLQTDWMSPHSARSPFPMSPFNSKYSGICLHQTWI